MHKFTNALSKEDSLYLLQHAHNPVDWLPWSEAAKEKAKKENKLMLISIGYSSCHWCHVMEHESFEDELVANVMNENFVCVKVDREERPDVDQIYMEAVQMMTGQGGWPLNCFTTPEGKPVYGGTYFPRGKWVQVLEQLSELWKENADKVKDYGDQLTRGMRVSGVLPRLEGEQEFAIEKLEATVENWKTRFDYVKGGPNKAPKFPLPSNYSFLLKYGYITGNQEIINQVKLTLNEMAIGGIFDQIGGGFTRYSTDSDWKVPHFEKMLYDNAQLLSLYYEAYGAFGEEEYLHTASGIKSWLRREMRNGRGGFYSALDADSEGVEGRFYVWSKKLLEREHPEYADLFHLDHRAIWEDQIIPVRKGTIKEMATSLNVSTSEVEQKLGGITEKLLSDRSKRVRPGTDDKSLCSWNAMLISGFAKAFIFGKKEEDLGEAKRILGFIENELQNPETKELKHTWKNGIAKINGFLEDYAFLIDAYLHLYEATFDERYLHRARALSFLTLDKFYNDKKGIFFFTASDQNDLVTRPMEMSDNVIPASNSVMAINLYKLAGYFQLPHFEKVAKRLLMAVREEMEEYGEGYSNWGELWLRISIGSPELVAGGEGAVAELKAAQFYSPLVLKAAADESSELYLLKGRINEALNFYVCQDQSCKSPVSLIDQVEKELSNIFTVD